MERNPDISFEDALENEYKKFGVFGFTGLVGQKQVALQNYYWKMIKDEMIVFFSIPKIIFSAVLFYGLFRFFSNPTELHQQIWFGIEIALFVVTIFLWIYSYRSTRRNKNKWLIHSISNYFYILTFVCIIWLTFRTTSGNSNFFKVILDTFTSSIYILFLIILFTKITPLLKTEIKETEKRFQTL